MKAKAVLDFWFREGVNPDGSVDEWHAVWIGGDFRTATRYWGGR